MRDLTAREAAERVEQFGDDLLALSQAFDRDCNRMSPFDERVNAIEHQDHLETIAKAFQALGDRMCRECEHAEEADDRRRDNPLEPDHRRLG